MAGFAGRFTGVAGQKNITERGSPVKKCCHAGLFPVTFPTVSEWPMR
jgi:hypothetical protein